MATADQNKAEIDRLIEDVGKLATANDSLNTNVKTIQKSLKGRKMPARMPDQFEYGEVDFEAFAATVLNYMKTMNVNQADRVACLLTFLNRQAFTLVTRVYNEDKLVTTAWDKAVENIASVLTQKMNRSEAMVKLLSLKQRNSDLQEFISEIERMSLLSFPSATEMGVKDRCMSATLTAGALNAQVRFELAKFQEERSKQKPPVIVTFGDLCVKAMEVNALIPKDPGTSGMVCNVQPRREKPQDGPYFEEDYEPSPQKNFRIIQGLMQDIDELYDRLGPYNDEDNFPPDGGRNAEDCIDVNAVNQFY